MPNNNYLYLAGLFFVQSFSRGILLSVIPLQTLALTGDAQRTSTLLFAISAGGILAALVTPVVIQRIGHYRMFLFGCAMMFISVILLASGDLVFFSVGLFCHVFSIAASEVALTLYVLARVPRRELTRFEPWRVFCTVLALCIGPFLGVYLQTIFFHQLPFVISAVFVFLSIIYFRLLGLHTVIIPRSGSQMVNPLRHLARYFKQPRLSLAYALVLARSCWWTMFVIYTPIYAARSGLGELAGAALVSIGTAWTLSVPFWGWIGRRYGIRYLLRAGFFLTGALSTLVYLYAGSPVIASAILVISALGATMLDGVGNVLFYRAVRSRERSEMTAVFVTYRDFGQLATPGLYSVLLAVFSLPVVFSSAAVWMFIAGYFCRYIPKRLR
ncbi:MAG: MFS transporter [Gammaproteobacteria bacterium]|nr:MFS transporter [Gammaproteobacteria bacterium]MDH3466623.1 MFS transporter [Gammaproteobacteria bacterium]